MLLITNFYFVLVNKITEPLYISPTNYFQFNIIIDIVIIITSMELKKIMLNKNHIRKIIKDENAISEEFTALPALSVVMIGFTIFVILISNTYSAYNVKIDNLEKYQIADFIATKLTNPDCYFMMEGGVVNLPLLDSSNPALSDDKLNAMRKQYNTAGVNFSINVNWEGGIAKFFPENSLPLDIGDRVAVSKTISVFLNEAQTKPGKLTIITWSV